MIYMSIIVNHVTYSYEKAGEKKNLALSDISLSIDDGEYIALIGHTGSGKSTLAKMLNGLLKPTQGAVYYNGVDLSEKGYDLKALRGKVGLVFQFPEHQLFEETVFKDVCYGPLNFGCTQKEAQLKAYAALKSVGLSDDCFYQSPFTLSGGEKRRAAIAGVLALEPEVLILDEPTAGLDPNGHNTIMQLIHTLWTQKSITVILITHSMDDAACFAKRVIIMDKGKIAADGNKRRIFTQREKLANLGLDVPASIRILEKLRGKGIPVNPGALTLSEAADEIAGLFSA